MKIHLHPAHTKPLPKGIIIREIGWDLEAFGLRIEEGDVCVADVGGGEVGDSGGAVCDTHGGGGGEGGEGDVLLEPEEGGGDGGAEVCGCVDEEGDVG